MVQLTFEAVYEAEPSDLEPLIMERIEPIAMIGQLKPFYNNKIAEGVALKPHQAIDKANAAAALDPDQKNFINAIQIYPYTIGAFYQVYAAPEQVTDVGLQPGEQLMSVSAGDTLRWVVGDTVSGTGSAAQVHILVTSIKPGLKTNLIVATSKRTYHLEFTSYREAYMAAVSWRYPHDAVSREKAKASKTKRKRQSTAARGLTVDRLNFRYAIHGNSPPWRPLRAFDDGRKVFIQFPARLDQGEAPPLFVVGRGGDSRLVNYRVNGHYYIVDRLFAAAELRLGENDQQVVRILRTSGKVGRR